MILIGAGSILDEMSFFDSGRRSALVRATTPIELAELRLDDSDALAEEDPRLGLRDPVRPRAYPGSAPATRAPGLWIERPGVDEVFALRIPRPIFTSGSGVACWTAAGAPVMPPPGPPLAEVTDA